MTRRGVTTLPEKFNALRGEPGKCWEWPGYRIEGYGQTSGCDRKKYRTHRYAYELWVGPIPEGMVLDHLCRNRACMNPEHLEVVTNAENTRRRELERTHCKRGHLLAGDNLLTVKGKGNVRRCRECTRLWGGYHMAIKKGNRHNAAAWRAKL